MPLKNTYVWQLYFCAAGDSVRFSFKLSAAMLKTEKMAKSAGSERGCALLPMLLFLRNIIFFPKPKQTIKTYLPKPKDTS